MYKVGSLKDRGAALELKSVFQARGISGHVTLNPATGEWVVEVEREEDRVAADSAYRTVLGIPQNYEVPQEWEKIRALPLGRTTFFLLVTSCLIFVLGFLPEGRKSWEPLFISSFSYPLFQEIQAGEIWRLWTPCLLHFGFLHIIFNMLWLKDLGSMIEYHAGRGFFVAFVLGAGVISNIGQYLAKGPAFGGMSGVLYGLLGFIWLHRKFNPNTEMVLPKSDVAMMLVWFFLCLIGMIGNVANTAHGVGLACGMTVGLWYGRGGSGALKDKSNILNKLAFQGLAIGIAAGSLVVDFLKR